MKSTFFAASFAFLALFSLASCNPVGDNAQAQPSKPQATQAAFPAARFGKTLKSTNSFLAATNSRVEEALNQKIAADAVAMQVVSTLKSEIIALHDELYFDRSPNDPAAAYAEWAKKQPQLVGKLTEELGKLSGCSTRELANFSVNANMFELYAEPLMSQADFAAMSADEKRAYGLLLQQDLLNLHNLLLNVIFERIGKLDIRYDAFDVIANATKPAVKVGEEFQTEIALGAYSTQASFKVAVDGKNVPVAGGKAIYKVKPTAAGKQTYNVVLSLTNPLTGETVKVNKTFAYEALPAR